MTQLRKWSALLGAIIAYYLVHEGAHVVVAALLGKLQGVRIAAYGLGVQVLADTATMTPHQIFAFCVAGVVATTLVGYAHVAARHHLAQQDSRFVRALGYYGTLVLLLLDPLYLSVLYRFFGGGDLNGITGAGISEVGAALSFGILGIVNLVVFLRVVYPVYRDRAAQDA